VKIIAPYCTTPAADTTQVQAMFVLSNASLLDNQRTPGYFHTAGVDVSVLSNLISQHENKVSAAMRVMYISSLHSSAAAHYLALEPNAATLLCQMLLSKTGGIDSNFDHLRDEAKGQVDRSLIVDACKVLFHLAVDASCPRLYEAVSEDLYSRTMTRLCELLAFNEKSWEAKDNSSAPSVAISIVMGPIKRSISHMFMDQKDAGAKFYEENATSLAGTLSALAELAAIERASDDHQDSLNLAPILTVLQTLTAASDPLRQLAKKWFFRSLADKDAPLPEPANEQDKKVSSPVLSDPHANPVTKQLLKHMTASNDALRVSVSELFWAIAEEDSTEYMRLVGFGYGVGLLAAKGLPGFAHLATNAINLDDMVAAAAARSGNNSTGPIIEEETEADSEEASLSRTDVNEN
jgi:Guanine nucleotide exchange factor synembryn